MASMWAAGIVAPCKDYNFRMYEVITISVMLLDLWHFRFEFLLCTIPERDEALRETGLSMQLVPTKMPDKRWEPRGKTPRMGLIFPTLNILLKSAQPPGPIETLLSLWILHALPVVTESITTRLFHRHEESMLNDKRQNTEFTSIRITSKSSVRLRLLTLTNISQCHDVSMMAWLSFWLASNATEELTSTAPQSANPTATSAATTCRARTAAN